MTVKYVTGSTGKGDYVCDGEDDQEEINEALQWAITGKNNVVYLKGGYTYNIDDTVRIGSNTTLVGDPNAKIRLVDNARWPAGQPLIGQIGGYGSFLTNVRIGNFQIDGNESNQPEMWGKDYYRLISFTGVPSKSITNISVYNMKLFNSLGDGFRVKHGDNISYYNNKDYNLQHCSCMFQEVNNGTICNCSSQAITCAGYRTDNSRNINIYNNTVTPFTGTTKAYKNAHNSIQIGNSPASGMTHATNNINIYNNTLDGGDCGILLFDATGLGNSTTQQVQIHNNMITNAGGIGTGIWDSGIGIQRWNTGATLTGNVINSCYCAGILVLDCEIVNTISNSISNIKEATDLQLQKLSVSGYGIQNMGDGKVYSTGNTLRYNATGNTYGNVIIA